MKQLIIYYFSRFALYCCWLMAAVPVLSQSSVAQLDHQITSLIEKAAIPGLSVGLIRDGTLIYTRGFGRRSTDTGGRVDGATVFSAASLSKPVFAYAVLQLVEEGRFDLDKPLCQYLPYEDAAHDERYQQITARMALSHTSGFPNWRRGRLDLQFNPGQRFSYSGEGFVYLMQVVETVTGQSLETMMQERVFQPLGMERSSYVWQERFEDNHANPHDELSRTAPLNRFESANTAYSLQTTAADYAKFILAILHAEGLDAAMIGQMLTPQVQVPKDGSPDGLSDQLSWGLGFGLQRTDQGLSFWHWGDNGTFRCLVVAIPQSRSGMVYFTNSYNGLSIMEDMNRICLGTDLPAQEMLDYTTHDHPAYLLLEKIIKQGYEKAVQPLLAESGRYFDPELLSEDLVNNLGYQLLRMGQMEAAQRVFGSNLLAFPTSANVYDSYAESCLRNGDLIGAEKYYRLAAEKDPANERAAAVVRQLAAPSGGDYIFQLRGYENARFVGLAGEFNGWDPLRNIMLRRDGQWECRLDLMPGEYQYKLVVDGIWILDPSNPESTYTDGDHNSVIRVEE